MEHLLLRYRVGTCGTSAAQLKACAQSLICSTIVQFAGNLGVGWGIYGHGVRSAGGFRHAEVGSDHMPAAAAQRDP
jgi:hypothetical protein